MKLESVVNELFEKSDFSDDSGFLMVLNDLKHVLAEVLGNKRNFEVVEDFLSSNELIKRSVLSLDFENMEVSKAFILGQFSSILDVFQIEKNKDLEINMYTKLLKKSKYLDQFMKLLSVKGFISNQEVLFELNITKSNLSNLINRIEKYDVFSIRKIKNEKYYFITKKGRKLNIYIKRNQEDAENNVRLKHEEITVDNRYFIEIKKIHRENIINFYERKASIGHEMFERKLTNGYDRITIH